MHPYDLFKAHSTDDSQKIIFEYNGRFFEGSATMGELLKCMVKAESEKEGISDFCDKFDFPIETVKNILNNSFLHIIQTDPAQETSFIWHKELISSKIVNDIAKHLKFLIRPELVWLIIGVTILTDIALFIFNKDVWAFHGYIHAEGFLLLFIYIFLSSLIHEFGHAAACSLFGLKCGGIGMALYINFPVMYSDVTQIWKLPKIQRCIVNAAGIYFQSFILMFSILGYTFTGQEFLKYIIISLNLGIILTINPILKFDGYWIVSDLLGIYNLRKKSRRFTCSFLKEGKVNMPRISLKKRIIFSIYTIASNLFFLFFFFYLIPSFIINIIKICPKEASLCLNYLNNSMAPPFSVVKDLLSQLIFICLFLYWVTFTIRNVFRNFYHNT